MRILTTSDLNGVNGGIAPLVPITWAVVVDTGFPSAIAGAASVGWAIGNFVNDNIDSYSSGGGWTWGGPSTTGSCRAPTPDNTDDYTNCDAAGNCW